MGENTVMGVNKTQSMPEILKEKDDVKVTYVQLFPGEHGREVQAYKGILIFIKEIFDDKFRKIFDQEK